MHTSIHRQLNTFRTSVMEKNSLYSNTSVIFSRFFVAWSVWQCLPRVVWVGHCKSCKERLGTVPFNFHGQAWLNHWGSHEKSIHNEGLLKYYALHIYIMNVCGPLIIIQSSEHQSVLLCLQSWKTRVTFYEPDNIFFVLFCLYYVISF